MAENKKGSGFLIAAGILVLASVMFDIFYYLGVGYLALAMLIPSAAIITLGVTLLTKNNIAILVGASIYFLIAWLDLRLLMTVYAPLVFLLVFTIMSIKQRKTFKIWLIPMILGILCCVLFCVGMVWFAINLYVVSFFRIFGYLLFSLALVFWSCAYKPTGKKVGVVTQPTGQNQANYGANYAPRANAQQKSSSGDYTSEIERLKRLYDIGAITAEEFDAKKKQLLGL